MWSAYLFQTANGQVGPKVDFGNLQWSISLNDTENFSLNLSKSSLPNLDLRFWLEPWWAGVLVCWNDIPIVAGPITQRPTESFDEVSLECLGIRALLARRLIINELSDWTQISTREVAYRDMSLGSIAREVVKLSQLKPGGALPISFPVPNSGRRGHERTYKGFNLSNIFVDDVLTKISEVTNGPDIMFRPRLVAANQLTFDMWHGVEENPRLPQTSDIIFDTTAQFHGISELRVVVTGAYQTHRVFATGAGQDEGTLIRMAQNLEPSRLGFPFLESVYSSGDVEDPAVVLGHAQSNLKQNSKNLLELSMKITADGPYPLGTYQVGDLVQIITSGWISIPEGTVRARILNINGSDSTNIGLSLQIED